MSASKSLLLRIWRTAEEAMYRPDQGGGAGAELPPVQLRYVATTGNDVSGNGSFAQPFATVSHALTTITDATALKPYVVFVSPGAFTDDIPLKSDISIKGVDPSDRPTFSGALSISGGYTAGNPTGIADCIFTAAQTLDFSALAGTSFALVDNEFAAVFRLTGCIASIRSNRFANDSHFVDVPLHSQDNAFVSSDGGANFSAETIDVTWLSNGDDFGSSLNVSATAPQTMEAQHIGSQAGGGNTLTLTGAGVTFEGTAGAIPPSVVLAGGAAAPILWTQGNSIGYSAHTPGNWAGSAPAAVTDQNTLANSAIDRLAAAVEGILGHAIP